MSNINEKEVEASCPTPASSNPFEVSFLEHSLTMVTFIVGAEDVKKTFLVHQHLAAAHSPFFKAAFESPMIEGITQTMKLEDVEVEMFGVVVNWMYKEKLKERRSLFTNNAGKLDFDMIPLAKIWMLAQRLLMPHLQNAAMVQMLLDRSNASDDALVKYAQFIFTADNDTRLQYVAIHTIKWERKLESFHYIIVRLPGDVCRIILIVMAVGRDDFKPDRMPMERLIVHVG